jgi:caa(3)-type oxidase subunit IV
MSDSHAHDVRKEIKTYIAVFVSLAVLTVVTVWVARFEFTVAMGVLVALIIAGFKGSLVASFFMHLVSEKKGVVWVLILTAVFFLALIFLPLGALMDQQGVPTDVP